MRGSFRLGPRAFRIHRIPPPRFEGSLSASGTRGVFHSAGKSRRLAPLLRGELLPYANPWCKERPESGRRSASTPPRSSGPGHSGVGGSHIGKERIPMKVMAALWQRGGKRRNKKSLKKKHLVKEFVEFLSRCKVTTPKLCRNRLRWRGYRCIPTRIFSVRVVFRPRSSLARLCTSKGGLGMDDRLGELRVDDLRAARHLTDRPEASSTVGVD